MKIGKLQLWDSSFLPSSLIPPFLLPFSPPSLLPSLPSLFSLTFSLSLLFFYKSWFASTPLPWMCLQKGAPPPGYSSKNSHELSMLLHAELLHILLRSVSSANGDHRLVLAKRQTLLGLYSMFFVHDCVVRFAYLTGYNCRSCILTTI